MHNKSVWDAGGRGDPGPCAPAAAAGTFLRRGWNKPAFAAAVIISGALTGLEAAEQRARIEAAPSPGSRSRRVDRASPPGPGGLPGQRGPPCVPARALTPGREVGDRRLGREGCGGAGEDGGPARREGERGAVSEARREGEETAAEAETESGKRTEMESEPVLSASPHQLR